MWVKQIHKPSPSHHLSSPFFGWWYVYRSQMSTLQNPCWLMISSGIILPNNILLYYIYIIYLSIGDDFIIQERGNPWESL